VVEGNDGRKLEPGHVYVIRPDTRMAVTDGCLRVEPRPSDRVFDAPIDYLFNSLADQYSEKAIGVVLSGSGTDGANGIRAIKAAGGIAVAQDPLEAQTEGMPRAAIATGAVELTLPAAEIGRRLDNLSRHPYFRHATPAHVDDGPPSATEENPLAPIFQLLRRGSGVNFAQYKAATIARKTAAIKSFCHYLEQEGITRSDPSTAMASLPSAILGLTNLGLRERSVRASFLAIKYARRRVVPLTCSSS